MQHRRCLQLQLGDYTSPVPENFPIPNRKRPVSCVRTFPGGTSVCGKSNARFDCQERRVNEAYTVTAAGVTILLADCNIRSEQRLDLSFSIEHTVAVVMLLSAKQGASFIKLYLHIQSY